MYINFLMVSKLCIEADQLFVFIKELFSIHQVHFNKVTMLIFSKGTLKTL